MGSVRRIGLIPDDEREVLGADHAAMITIPRTLEPGASKWETPLDLARPDDQPGRAGMPLGAGACLDSRGRR